MLVYKKKHIEHYNPYNPEMPFPLYSVLLSNKAQ